MQDIHHAEAQFAFIIKQVASDQEQTGEPVSPEAFIRALVPSLEEKLGVEIIEIVVRPTPFLLDHDEQAV